MQAPHACAKLFALASTYRRQCCLLAFLFLAGAAVLGGRRISADDPQPAAAADSEDAKQEFPFNLRERAPSLDGGTEWFNTAGPIDLKDLRGKFVLLDFWTYCCINCMHILPELKKLEHALPNELVVIGVHSAKFDAEQDSKNIRDAILRYGIEHPVVNDANHAIWDKFGVQSWPTLRLIDPEGNLVGGQSGEISFESLNQVFQRALPFYRVNRLLDETPLHFEREEAQAKPTALRYPGKILADERGNRLFIADSSHNRVVVSGLDGTLLETIGTGSLGKEDGDFAHAQFNHPQGMALEGETLYVADTENHLLRKVDLAHKTVSTIAGTGEQAHLFPGMKEKEEGDEEREAPHKFVGKPLETALNSPWDLLIHKGELYIAMAGPHQIWKMPLDESEISVFAGNGREDIIDGPNHPRAPYQPGTASFAQPSGLATDGHNLFVADSEGSSIRSVQFSGSGRTHTVIGTAQLPYNRLFTFGDEDGRGANVRLQHPLGLAWYNDRLYIADTYNNKIKALDVKHKTCETVAGTPAAANKDREPLFDEPAGLSPAAHKLYVADTNAHRIRVIDLDQGNQVSTLEIRGLAPPAAPTSAEVKPLFDTARRIDLPAADVQASGGKLRLSIHLKLPDGYKINDLAPMAYQFSVADSKPAGLVAADGLDKPKRLDKPQASFGLELPVAAAKGKLMMTLALRFYYCQEGAEGVCKMSSVAWHVPLELRPDALAERLDLVAAP